MQVISITHLPQVAAKGEHHYKIYKEFDITPKLRKHEGHNIDFDEKNIKILKILSEDARMSTYKIGELVKLSSDAVSYRIKKMIGYVPAKCC